MLIDINIRQCINLKFGDDSGKYPIQAVQEPPRIELGRVHHHNGPHSVLWIYAHLAMETTTATFFEQISHAVHLADVPAERHRDRPACAVVLWRLHQMFCFGSEEVRNRTVNYAALL